jgi:hypothetical protein
MSQRSSHDDRQSSSAESGQESGELSAEPSVKKARVDDASKPISPEKAWNYAEDDSTGASLSRLSCRQICSHVKKSAAGFCQVRRVLVFVAPLLIWSEMCSILGIAMHRCLSLSVGE